jgi:hypothetical protein
MVFIHHTTGAAVATGLMAESARLQGSASLGHPCLPATELPGLPVSATRIGGYPFYPADHRAAAGDPQHGQEAAEPISSARYHVVKEQVH